MRVAKQTSINEIFFLNKEKETQHHSSLPLTITHSYFGIQSNKGTRLLEVERSRYHGIVARETYRCTSLASDQVEGILLPLEAHWLIFQRLVHVCVGTICACDFPAGFRKHSTKQALDNITQLSSDQCSKPRIRQLGISCFDSRSPSGYLPWS